MRLIFNLFFIVVAVMATSEMKLSPHLSGFADGDILNWNLIIPVEFNWESLRITFETFGDGHYIADVDDSKLGGVYDLDESTYTLTNTFNSSQIDIEIKSINNAKLANFLIFGSVIKFDDSEEVKVTTSIEQLMKRDVSLESNSTTATSTSYDLYDSESSAASSSTDISVESGVVDGYPKLVITYAGTLGSVSGLELDLYADGPFNYIVAHASINDLLCACTTVSVSSSEVKIVISTDFTVSETDTVKFYVTGIFTAGGTANMFGGLLVSPVSSKKNSNNDLIYVIDAYIGSDNAIISLDTTAKTTTVSRSSSISGGSILTVTSNSTIGATTATTSTSSDAALKLGTSIFALVVAFLMI